MKRRDLLKNLTVAAGGTLCSGPTWNIARGQTAAPPPAKLATPIRALVRTDKGLRQPVQISLPNSGGSAVAITKLDGAEVDRRTISDGVNVFEVYATPTTSMRSCMVSVVVNGSQQWQPVEIKPVRQALFYVLPHSHHDLGYTDLQANVEEKQIRNIKLGIDLASKTADYPEGARFIWNLEVLWGADLYLQRRSQEEKAEFVEAVRKGWVALNGSYANELTGLCRPEELLQLFRYSTVLGKQCGKHVDSAMMSDVPGYTWGTVSAFSQAGIRYFSAAPNFFDRIGTFMVTWQDKPFWWIGPSGKEKVLFWAPWLGYAMSHVMKLGPEFAETHQDRMDDIHYPYDISYIRWSHGDNGAPDPEIVEFVRTWNEKYEWPRFSIASVSTAFSAFEKRYGNQLPQYRGDLTPYWEDGAGSSALETKLNRGAADRLSTALALSAINPSAYVPAAYNAAWRNVLLYSEHTWGAARSVSDSESELTKKQWEVKRGFAVDADKASQDLLKSALGQASPSPNLSTMQIHNPTSWDRTEVINLATDLSVVGDHVSDHAGRPVPSQRLSTGELAVLVTNVPAFGAATYTISAEKAHLGGQRVTVKDGVLDNGLVRAKIDSASGNIVELNLQGNPQNLVDRLKGNGLNEYLFLAGNDVDHLQRSGPATIIVEESGPLVASIRIECSAPGSRSLLRRVRLFAGRDHLEITNVVDKERAALNPHPGGGPAGEFAQRGSKESLQFSFPLSVPGGKMTMDVPLGNMRPEVDQLPGACKNWLPVGRWIDVSNADYGVTWATLDAPLVELGSISAMLGSQSDPSVWRKHIEQTQTVYSWVMNNHWGTNYRAYQEGPVEFRYALRPHKGHNAGAANRFAIGLSQPLLPTPGSSQSPQSGSLLRVQPDDVLALTLKPSDDGNAWIVRLFNASGEPKKATLTWPKLTIGKTWRSNLAEDQLEPAASEIPVGAWELVTLRTDRT